MVHMRAARLHTCESGYVLASGTWDNTGKSIPSAGGGVEMVLYPIDPNGTLFS